MNKIKQRVLGMLVIGLICSQAIAAEVKQTPKSEPFPQEVRNFIEQLTKDNNIHIENISKENFKNLSESQSPRATVVSCSDSRVQTDAYHQSPINDLFFIRNIGNQIQSAEGSVEYGINHLKTPILLIMGHSQCGAIHAAMGDYSKESKAIKNELNNLDLLKGNDTDEGVIANVHNQVNFAINKFQDKIKNKELTVIGLIYDFRDDFGHGHGKMMVIDVNGETDAERLKAMPLLQGIPDIAIGEKRVKAVPTTAPAKGTPPKGAIPAPDPIAGEKLAGPEAQKTKFKFNLDFFKRN